MNRVQELEKLIMLMASEWRNGVEITDLYIRELDMIHAIEDNYVENKGLQA